MSSRTKIIVYTHGVLIIPGNHTARDALLEYSYGLCEFTFAKKPPSWRLQKVITKVYASWNKARTEFRFHVNLMDDILKALSSKGFGKTQLDFEYMEPSKGVKVDFSNHTLYDPREYQDPIIDHLSVPDTPIKVTNLQTGRGKTLCAFHAMVNLGVRTMIQLRGGYVDRWVPDIKEFFHVKKGELLVIRGRDSLLSLFNMAKNNDDDFKKIKIIIVTSKTIFNYIKDFDADPKKSIYQLRPELMYETLGVGLKIIDELHEDYHLNFKSDIYSNVSNGIYLSATLDTKDDFRRKMYNIAHPPHTWISTEYDAYVAVRAKMYTMNDINSVRTSHKGDTKYSHSAYELSILESSILTENYMKIIYESFAYEFFIENPYENGQKIMVFCSTVEMCENVCQYLRGKMPDLTVEVYVAGVPTKILLNSDAVITTVESAGTAVDVKGLKVVCLTRALDKFEKNEQIKGRLRKMSAPWEHVRPMMIYLSNTLIEKHVTYHLNKMEHWKGLVYSHTTLTLETRL